MFAKVNVTREPVVFGVRRLYLECAGKAQRRRRFGLN
jgi:hypothetical protein